jgi:hypothetical protein
MYGNINTSLNDSITSLYTNSIGSFIFSKGSSLPVVCTLMRSLEVTYFLFLRFILDKSIRSVTCAPEATAPATLSLLAGSIETPVSSLIKF